MSTVSRHQFPLWLCRALSLEERSCRWGGVAPSSALEGTQVEWGQADRLSRPVLLDVQFPEVRSAPSSFLNLVLKRTLNKTTIN